MVLEFVFENCDVVTIDGRYIGNFLVDDLKTRFSRMAINHVGRMDLCGEFYVEINHRAFEGLKTHFDEDALSRIITWNDITSISFSTTDDEEMHTYYVTYEEDVPGALGANNLRQASYVNPSGDLFLKISDKALFDYISKDEADDEPTIETYFRMVSLSEE